jgi:hypothetical protein
MKPLQIRLDDRTRKHLAAEARRTGEALAVVIRRILREWVEDRPKRRSSP